LTILAPLALPVQAPGHPLSWPLGAALALALALALYSAATCWSWQGRHASSGT
jgi:hypothetical protein